LSKKSHFKLAFPELIHSQIYSNAPPTNKKSGYIKTISLLDKQKSPTIEKSSNDEGYYKS
jgi:hypothetical protein